MAQVTAFPWHALPRASSSDCRKARLLGHYMAEVFDTEAMLDIASNLMASEIEVTLRRRELCPPPMGAQCTLLFADEQRAFMLIELEPDLGAAALSRLLGRPVRLTDPNAPLEPSLQGALAALALELLRTGARLPFKVMPTAPPALPPLGLRLSLAMKLDNRRYGLTVWLATGSGPVAPSKRILPASKYPSDLRLDLPVVVAHAATPAGQLMGLGIGDVWLSHDGWWINHSKQGTGALCAPNADFGVAADVSVDRIVLGKERVTLNAVSGPVMNTSKPNASTPSTLDQTLADVPVEVRIELGKISLPASEWAELQPGDVVPFTSEGVVLRVAGQELARGELVQLDGELGVRVTQVMPTKAS